MGYDGAILKTTNGGGYPNETNDLVLKDRIFKIYPNPASTFITIETPAKVSLTIHNTSGQQILQQQFTEPTTTVDVSGWKSGVYLVKVVGEKGVSVGKFIKQ